MSQIRIDESLFNDVRFKMLAQKMDESGNFGEALALEMFVKVCFLAQRYWRDNRKLIPLKIWNFDPRYKLLEECDLAKQNKDGVYLSGSNAFFDWYHNKKEAGRVGGIKSGISRKKIKDTKEYEAKQTKQKIEADEAECRTKEPSSVSVSVSSSVSVSDSSSVATYSSPVAPAPGPVQINDPKPKPKKATEPSEGTEVWAAYSDAYRYRYRVEPVRNARANANCKDLVKRLGKNEAIQVVQFYLGHNHSWYVQKSHAIGLCLADAESLHTQMLTNNQVTSSQAQKLDKGSEQAAIFAKVTRELEEKYPERFK